MARIDIRKDYREQLRLLRGLTKSLRAKLVKIFNTSSRKLASSYKRTGIINTRAEEELQEKLELTIQKHYRVCITEQERRMRRVYTKQVDEDEIERIIAQYIALHGAAQVNLITETTRKRLSAIIQSGIADGLSIVAISSNIQRSAVFSQARATLIARTETHTALNFGAAQVAKKLGFKNPKKQWNSARDDRTRSWHRAVDGQVVLETEDFEILTPTAGGGTRVAYMSYAGDTKGGSTNVINCRCFITRYDEDDEIIN